MIKKNYIIFLVLIFFTFSCQPDQNTTKLDNKITALEKSVDSLKKVVNLLKRVQQLNEQIKDLRQMAYLKPGDNGYNIIKFEIGTLIVGLENIEPYANGSKITLRWGNLTSARINGLKMTIEYGSVANNDVALNNEAKSKKVTLDQSLEAGSFTKAEIVLEKVRPKNLGFIRITNLSNRGISLKNQ